jgi:hypothetical protein
LRADDRHLSVRQQDASWRPPPGEPRYCALVECIRGIIKTRINTALNRLVDIHAPAEIAVERLDFRMPGLSRRFNRIITNCGRAVFTAKLADLNERFGIETAESILHTPRRSASRAASWTAATRKSQSEFRCLHCGHNMAHADVNGAKVVAKIRSLGLDFGFTPRGQVLGVLRKSSPRDIHRAPRHRPADRREKSRREEMRLSLLASNMALTTNVNNCHHEFSGHMENSKPGAMGSVPWNRCSRSPLQGANRTAPGALLPPRPPTGTYLETGAGWIAFLGGERFIERFYVLEPV